MLLIPSIITKVATMADGGLRVTLDCNEMPAERIAELIKAKGLPIIVAIANEEGFTPQETQILNGATYAPQNT